MQYATFLKDLPYLGGSKNTHNGTAKSRYNCDPDQHTYANADICDYWIEADIPCRVPCFSRFIGT